MTSLVCAPHARVCASAAEEPAIDARVSDAKAIKPRSMAVLNRA
jgi:hypothetical protein